MVVSSSMSRSLPSHLTREEQVLLNFDEGVAICYFALVVCYGYFKCQNWKVATVHQRQVFSTNTTGQSNGFTFIHWLIASVAMMGLANFLFSVSLLEVMDHNSPIGSKVLKLSYVNMFLACLRHPCTLCLGVLAPKVAFGSDLYYYFPSQSTAAGENIRGTAMCLAALACTQMLLRLTENLMVMFRYGGRADSQTVKLADSFEHILDGVLLIWMVRVLYRITEEISRDEYQGRVGGGMFGRSQWQAWWKSKSLLFFWILYTLFVTASTVLIVIGIAAFLGAKSLRQEHVVYTCYKMHATVDLLLVAGIAIVLRPKQPGQPHEVFRPGLDDNDAFDGISDVNYSLLRAGSQEEEEPDRAHGGEIGNEEEEVSFEMSNNPRSVSSELVRST